MNANAIAHLNASVISLRNGGFPLGGNATSKPCAHLAGFVWPSNSTSRPSCILGTFRQSTAWASLIGDPHQASTFTDAATLIQSP